MRLHCLGLPFLGWVTSGNMMMQTIGKTAKASFLSMARQGLFFIPLVIGLPYLILWVFDTVEPLVGIQVAQPLADIISFAVSVPMTVGVLRTFQEDK